jgi:hypothetical protein
MDIHGDVTDELHGDGMIIIDGHDVAMVPYSLTLAPRSGRLIAEGSISGPEPLLRQVKKARTRGRPDRHHPLPWRQPRHALGESDEGLRGSGWIKMVRGGWNSRAQARRVTDCNAVMVNSRSNSFGLPPNLIYLKKGTPRSVSRNVGLQRSEDCDPLFERQMYSVFLVHIYGGSQPLQFTHSLSPQLAGYKVELSCKVVIFANKPRKSIRIVGEL